MAYCFSGIAVKNEKNKVVSSSSDFFKSHGGNLTKITDIEKIEKFHYLFRFLEKNGWTIIASDMSILPLFPIYLSKTLNTKVICIDEYSTVGYEHFSVINNGTVEMVHTYDGAFGSKGDSYCVDYKKFYQTAINHADEETSKRLKKRLSDSLILKEDVGELYTREAFWIFNKHISDINVEELTLECLEKSQEFYECDNANLATMGGDGPFWFFDLLKDPLKKPKKKFSEEEKAINVEKIKQDIFENFQKSEFYDEFIKKLWNK